MYDIFYKKNVFQSTKNFRRIQWQNMHRMASECISYNLEFQNFQGEHPRTPPPLGLRRSVRASGTQLSTYFVN